MSNVRARNYKLRQGGVRTLWLYILCALLLIPVGIALYAIRALWYGWAIYALAAGGMIYVLSTRLWYYRRFIMCMLLSFSVAIFGLVISKPQKNVSFMGQLTTGLLRVVMSLPLDDSVRSGAVFSETKLWTPPTGYQYRETTFSGVRMELLSCEKNPDNRLIIQYHGGAFVAGLNDMYRGFAVRYSEVGGGADVLTVDYKLYPKYSFPQQQQDAITAWRFAVSVLGYKPEKIVLAGDSAGGNLVLSTALYLRDNKNRLPRALVCFSPWADLSNSGESHITNARLDPSFGVGDDPNYDGSPIGVSSTYTVGHDPKDPRMSPSFGDYTGMPPILLQAGSIEILLSDSEMVRDNCLKVGTRCEMTVYNGMFHVFQALMDMTQESHMAWQEVEAFLKSVD